MVEQTTIGANIVLDEGLLEATVCGDTIRLSKTEFAVLRVLLQSPGRTFSRHEILDAVHGDKYAITPKAVDVQICGLRRKLGAGGSFVEAVRKVGYRVVPVAAPPDCRIDQDTATGKTT